MIVSNLLGKARIDCFSELLKRCEMLDNAEKLIIDGGAGLGETAAKILDATPGNKGKVIAFEPNPQNVELFRLKDERVVLRQEAVSNFDGEAEFLVTSTTREDKSNPYMESGSSYVGKLAGASGVSNAVSGGDSYPVRVRRIESVLRELGISQVDFLKLDLQGAELDALEGLGPMIDKVKWMWIEFSNQPGLLKFLADKGFVIFDTEYLFVGEPIDLIEELFEVTRVGQNSIGKKIFFGNRRHVWRDYEAGFNFCKARRRMIQTDIAAVHPEYLPAFLEAALDLMPSLPEGLRWTIPRGLF